MTSEKEGILKLGRRKDKLIFKEMTISWQLIFQQQQQKSEDIGMYLQNVKSNQLQIQWNSLRIRAKQKHFQINNIRTEKIDKIQI